uniref:Large ribosomal subunit protein uL6c n=1 Tax=Grateloupia filicina TaxID=31455 RepID=A0A2S1FX58_9FLOR|nr:50S ribosomal protein L6 [Grateloupia filicina]AWD77352.1 50S ribosomal protein L6 [Grateloupia filicina]
MSRIGKQHIILHEEISAEIQGTNVSIVGPRGEISHKLSNLIEIKKVNNKLSLHRLNNSKKAQSLHGLSRTLINNMVIGVSKGFSKQLEIQGVGYRAQIQGNDLILNVGYSHPVTIRPPKDISITVEKNSIITINGINKETVGQIAAKIRKVRPPEPYKGKGIKYSYEIIRKKVGKAGK